MEDPRGRNGFDMEEALKKELHGSRFDSELLHHLLERHQDMPVNKKKMQSLKEEYGSKKGEEMYYKMEAKEKARKKRQRKIQNKRSGKGK